MQVNNLKNINSLKAETFQKNLLDIRIKKDFNKMLEKSLALNQSQVSNNPSNKLISLGKINSKTSTVSQLIYNTSFKKDCWDIIYNDINSNKSFTKIKSNTESFIDPETKELIWGDKVKKYGNSNNNIDFAKSEKIFNKMPRMIASEFNFSKTPFFEVESKKLAQAVRKFIGKDYSQMDCYRTYCWRLKKYWGQISRKRRTWKTFNENCY